MKKVEKKAGGNRPAPDEKVMMAIVRVAELFKRRSAAIFKSRGLSFSQYNALRVLENAPGGRLSLTETSHLLLVSTPNMTGIAKRLEKGGFAIRGRDPADDRRTILEITPRGSEVVADIDARQKENVSAFFKDCPKARKKELLALLKEMLKLDE